MEDIRLYEEVLRLKKSGLGGVLITVIESRGSTPRKAGAKMLICEDGKSYGTVGGGSVEVLAREKAVEVTRKGRPETLSIDLTEEDGLTCGGGLRLYLEPLTPLKQCLVVGRGYIARALQELGEAAGFVVTLIDPPDEEDSGVPLYKDLEKRFAERQAPVIIACPTHRQDFVAARDAIRAKASFVGVVGSRRKRQSLQEYLAGQGCPESAIDAIVSPVGLAIGAETSGEIALSILAQLVSRFRQHED